MSEFFKALEQADRDRNRAAPARPRSTVDVAEPERSAAPERRPAPVRPSRAPAPDVDASAIDAHLVSLLTPASGVADRYRSLRYVVEQARAQRKLTVLGVSSAAEGAGTTTTVLNLAGALAQDDAARVLVIEGDLRSPAIAQRLGLADGPGLADAVASTLTLRQVTTPVRGMNLSVVPAGRTPATPYELLASPRLGALMDEARRDYDYVLLDMPPFGPLPDAQVLGQWVDAFLLVVRAHRTPRRRLAHALASLEPAQVLGLVFNEDGRAPARGGTAWR